MDFLASFNPALVVAIVGGVVWTVQYIALRIIDHGYLRHVADQLNPPQH